MITEDEHEQDIIEMLNIIIADNTFFVSSLVLGWPSVYELMPTEKYLELIGPYIFVNNSGVTTYEETVEILDSLSFWFSPSLMGKAEMFHNDLYSTGIHSSKLVNTRYIYGNDGLNDTLSRLDRIRLENLDVLFEGDKGIGDSLVCPASATIGEQDNANIAREYTGNHMYFSSPGFAIEYIID